MFNDDAITEEMKAHLDQKELEKIQDGIFSLRKG